MPYEGISRSSSNMKKAWKSSYPSLPWEKAELTERHWLLLDPSENWGLQICLCGGEVTEVPNWQKKLGNKFGVCWRLCELIRYRKLGGQQPQGALKIFMGFTSMSPIRFLMWRSKKHPFSSSDRDRLNIMKYTLAFAIMTTYSRREKAFPGPYPIWEKGILVLCPSLVFLSHIGG